MAYQPMSKRQARKPSQPLSAALKGQPANAPNPMDQSRQLAAGAPKKGQPQNPIKALTAANAGKPPRPINPPRPANQATGNGSTRLSDVLTAGAQTSISNVARKNTTSNARAGQSFLTETRTDRPGMEYHVYKDPKTGKRQVVGVRKGPLKGILQK